MIGYHEIAVLFWNRIQEITKVFCLESLEVYGSYSYHLLNLKWRSKVVKYINLLSETTTFAALNNECNAKGDNNSRTYRQKKSGGSGVQP